jgi:molybdopterin-containing oxidoreductase family iron-sulfur binding subunit
MRAPRHEIGQDLTRRKFVSVAAAGAAGYLLTACGPRRLHEVPPDRLREAIEKMERDYAERFGTAVSVSGTGPAPGVEFAYALDISRCIGCRRCVYACVEENNQSRDPQVHWIRVLSMEKEGGVHLSESDPYYDPELVPEEGKFYVPVQCQQCRNPPCTKVCPVGATWTEHPRFLMASSTPRCTTWETGLGQRGWWRNARSASKEVGRTVIPPALRSVP